MSTRTSTFHFAVDNRLRSITSRTHHTWGAVKVIAAHMYPGAHITYVWVSRGKLPPTPRHFLSTTHTPVPTEGGAWL